MTVAPDSPPRFSDYDDFAQVYNLFWRGFAFRVIHVLERLALRDCPPGAPILDLCCGVGELASLLSRRGYAVVGVDGSEAMLRYARENAPDARFHLADARSFDIPGDFAAAVSTYDSLNHVLALAELEQVFRQVYRSLAPGGVFVFDMNMEEGYLSRWAGVYPMRSRRAAVIMQAWYNGDKGLALADLTAFTPSESEENLWRRSDFRLTQRPYTVDELTTALENANFGGVEAYDSRRDFGMREEGRGFFRAVKT